MEKPGAAMPLLLANREEHLGNNAEAVIAIQATDNDQSLSPHPRGPKKVTLLWSLLILYMVLYATYAGVMSILLPAQVREIDPDNKATNLAIIMAVSSLATLMAHPIAGALSDRTRSRLGRRAPYILVGAAIGGMLLVGLHHLTSVLWIALAWVVIQVALNSLQGPASTIVADRFVPSSRGVASAFLGVGTAVGMATGIVVMGRLVAYLQVGYTILGVGIIVSSLLFVLVNRDYSSVNMPVSRMRWGEFFSSFWVSPRKHPDYAWAFAGRFFMILGYQAITAYMLYILMDYLGLDAVAAGVFAGIIAGSAMVTMVAATLLAGWLSDRYRRRKVFVFTASMLMAAALLIPVLVPTKPAMLVYALLSGAGYGAYTAVDMALMIDVLPSGNSAGKDLGVLNVATNIPQVLSPIVAAFLLSTFGGNYAALFVFAIVMVTVSSCMVLPIRSVR